MSNEILQHTYGSGEISFAQFLAGTQTPGARKYLGNTTEFTLNQKVESLTHMDADHGIKTEDDAIDISSTLEATLVTDNINQENVAFYFTGTSTIITDASGSALAMTIASVQFGTYQLGVTTAKPTGDRNASTVVVKDTMGGTVTYVAGTDYVVDGISGTVTFIPGGTMIEGNPAYITYSRAASTRTQVVSGNKSIEGSLFFKSFNAKGPRIDYMLPYVRMTPNGDHALKGDTWLTIPFSLKVLHKGSLARVYADGQSVLS